LGLFSAYRPYCTHGEKILCTILLRTTIGDWRAWRVLGFASKGETESTGHCPPDIVIHRDAGTM
jgi:hypothetical protein